MTFVTADSCRTRLQRLSQLLVAAFPGSTIYQHTELCRVAHDVLNNKVDAVILDAETDCADALDLMNTLRRQKPDVPVFMTSKTGDFRSESAEAGANGCFVLPEGEQQLLDAIRLAANKERVS